MKNCSNCYFNGNNVPEGDSKDVIFCLRDCASLNISITKLAQDSRNRKNEVKENGYCSDWSEVYIIM